MANNLQVQEQQTEGQEQQTVSASLDVGACLAKYMRSATEISNSYSRLNAEQRLGVTHASVGVFMIFLGLVFFFQSFLLSIGNGFLIYGIIEVIGIENFLYFLKPADSNTSNYGVFAFGLSIILLMSGWGLFGFLLELYSIYLILRDRVDSSELKCIAFIVSNFFTQSMHYLPILNKVYGNDEIKGLSFGKTTSSDSSGVISEITNKDQGNATTDLIDVKKTNQNLNKDQNCSETLLIEKQVHPSKLPVKSDKKTIPTEVSFIANEIHSKINNIYENPEMVNGNDTSIIKSGNLLTSNVFDELDIESVASQVTVPLKLNIDDNKASQNSEPFVYEIKENVNVGKSITSESVNLEESKTTEPMNLKRLTTMSLISEESTMNKLTSGEKKSETKATFLHCENIIHSSMTLLTEKEGTLSVINDQQDLNIPKIIGDINKEHGDVYLNETESLTSEILKGYESSNLEQKGHDVIEQHSKIINNGDHQEQLQHNQHVIQNGHNQIDSNIPQFDDNENRCKVDMKEEINKGNEITELNTSP